MATVDKLATSASHGNVQTTVVDGVPTEAASRSRSSRIYYATFDGKLVITDSPTGISGLKDGGQKLSDDQVFKDAKSAAGMPDETKGFVYVNVKDAAPMVEGLSALGGSGIPPDVSANLEHVRSFLAYGSGRATRTGSTRSSRSAEPLTRRAAVAAASLPRHGRPLLSLHVRVRHRRAPRQGRRPGLGHDPRRRARGGPARPRRLRDADHDRPRRRRRRDHDRDLRRHPAARAPADRRHRLHPREVRLRRRHLRRDRGARRAVARHRAGRRRVVRDAARARRPTTRSTGSARATRG